MYAYKYKIYLCVIFRSFENTVVDVTKNLHLVLCVGASRLCFLCRTDFGGRPSGHLDIYTTRDRPVRRRSAHHPMVGHARRLVSQPE